MKTPPRRQRDYANGWRTAIAAMTEATQAFPPEGITGETLRKVLGTIGKPPTVYQSRPPKLEALAERYGISRRSVSNWKAAGCPFSDGKRAVIRWAVRNGRVPEVFRERFKEEIDQEELKRLLTSLREAEQGLRKSMARQNMPSS